MRAAVFQQPKLRFLERPVTSRLEVIWQGPSLVMTPGGTWRFQRTDPCISSVRKPPIRRGFWGLWGTNWGFAFAWVEWIG